MKVQAFFRSGCLCVAPCMKNPFFVFLDLCHGLFSLEDTRTSDICASLP